MKKCLLLISLIITGCSGNPFQNKVDSSVSPSGVNYPSTVVPEKDTVVPTVTKIHIPTERPNDTIVPIPLSVSTTETSTVIPSIVTTEMSTPYPVQSLTAKQQLEMMDFLAEKPGCRLPCWNGLTPGISSSDELQGFFARLGHDFNSWDSPEDALEGARFVEMHNFPKGTYSSTQLIFEAKWSKGIVTSIGFGYWDHPEQFSIKHIADTLGVPSEIKIAQQQGEFYSLLLLYTERQLYIQIDGKRLVKRPFDNPLPFDICLDNQDHKDVNALLYSKEGYAHIASFLSEGWLNWSQVLGVSKEDLFQSLQQPGKCIQSP